MRKIIAGARAQFLMIARKFNLVTVFTIYAKKKQQQQQVCNTVNFVKQQTATLGKVTQGKHSVKRSLHKALHKRLSLVLRTWRPARTISYRPFLKHQRFAVWSLLINDYELFYGFGDWTLKSFKNWEFFSKFNFKS